ncbi:hypothetical protein [Bathymodiolus platifrons methanotrophic gill symbiont]|uniref:hypothetical protein n=1 Tax=Bathymodiolus platifrons methanotrophic gill symbiont TaxID=113268 RepID=UPI001C8D2DD8|nr:hypothetical protein [Bathymodiolus platifrons methanotrophic gill symbiont]
MLGLGCPKQAFAKIATPRMKLKHAYCGLPVCWCIFFVMAGFGLFIWNTLKNSKTKSTLLFFIVIAGAITAVETSYLLNVESADTPIASIYSFTFDILSGTELFTSNQLFIVQSTLNAINLVGFMVVPFGMMAGCCIMHQIPLTLDKGPEYFLGRSE